MRRAQCIAPRLPHDWFDAIAITRTTVWTYPRCNAAKLA